MQHRFIHHLKIWVGLFFLIGLFTFVWFWINETPSAKPEYGVTFSWVYARELGLEPLETYQSLIEELGVRAVRLPIYWSDIERDKEVYDWSLADSLIEFSQAHDVKLSVVVGMKVPRWPECFIPRWAQALDQEEQQKAVLSFIETTVNRYKHSTAIVRWQVENEPFFPFGECPLISTQQFKERVELVKKLDNRPVLVTVSGELGPWLDSAQHADVLGISLYRQTWNDVYGYFIYPIGPEFYALRSKLISSTVKKVIVSELQAEPWFFEPIENRSLADWYETFTVEMFEENISFVEQAGLSEVYLWGAEWWYKLKLSGDERLWNFGEKLFK